MKCLKSYGYGYEESYFEQELDSIAYYKGKKSKTMIVEFILNKKLVKVYFESCTKTKYNILPSSIDMKLLKAINEKVKELGWEE